LTGNPAKKHSLHLFLKKVRVNVFLASDGPDTSLVVRPAEPDTGDAIINWFE
jgi:hypothetical protein